MTPRRGHAHNPRHARAHRRDHERGSASLELIALFPLTLALVFGIVQGAMWYHARDAAQSAASIALTAASLETGTNGDAQAAAAELLNQVDALEGAQVSINRTATSVTVTVTGNSPQIIDFPGWDLTVSQSATGPVERWTS